MNELSKSNWLLTLAYDGTAYSGWQVQPDKITVQQVLQDKISTLFQADLSVLGCSRTDAGVHALCQKAIFYPPEWPPIDRRSTQKALNSLLPTDIRILSIEEVSVDFHPRHNAAGKAYTYLFCTEKPYSPFARNYFWSLGRELDFQAMTEATIRLKGTHDFTGFSVKSRGKLEIDNIRTLYSLTIKRIGSFVMLSIVGNRFLYKMVRRLVGFIIKVGKGQISPDVTSQMFNAEKRVIAFDTAPPQGLYLEEVFYDPDEIMQFKPRQLPFLKLLGLPDGADMNQPVDRK